MLNINFNICKYVLAFLFCFWYLLIKFKFDNLNIMLYVIKNFFLNIFLEKYLGI